MVLYELSRLTAKLTVCRPFKSPAPGCNKETLDQVGKLNVFPFKGSCLRALCNQAGESSTLFVTAVGGF